MNNNNKNIFKNFREYVTFNDRNPSFRRKTPKQKRADWQSYLMRKKKIIVDAQAIQENKNRRFGNGNVGGRGNANRGNRVLTRNEMTVNRLSECLLLYAQASIDPFARLIKMPCIPDNLCAPSFKFMSKVETQFTVGQTGIGFVAMNPWTMAGNNFGFPSTYVDAPIACTTGNYTLATVNIGAAEVTNGDIEIFNSNSPFNAVTIQGTPLRLVAAGIEIEYTGQLLNQSGAITVVQQPGLQYTPNPSTVSGIRLDPRARTCANSKDNRCYVSYYPTNEDVLSYKLGTNYVASDIGGPTNNHPLLIVVSGATPGITFMVRAVAYFEMQLAIADATPSEADPIGFPAFQAARTQTLPSSSPQSDLRSVLLNTVKNIGRTISGMGGTIGGAIGASLGNPVAGAALGTAAGDLLSSILGD